ncbi:NUDIX hydrolase [Pseudalkalibacillus sp. SCS-8]|uniref:NUDIX hydrolase n=1 Tax=Pseudalkalibacillus nanhaiensis TaxID=3115291 RepID=UPI0032D9C763
MDSNPRLIHKNTKVLETETGSLYIEEQNPTSVAVVAIRGEHLVLVRQFRHQLKGETIELPGGGLEDDEDPEMGAKRELLEETGIKADTMTYIGSFHPQPYFTNRFSHLFFTTDTASTGDQCLDEDEDISVMMMPVKEVLDSIRAGHYKDGELGYALFLCIVRGLIKPT